jgi:hypothetical protein
MWLLLKPILALAVGGGDNGEFSDPGFGIE